MFKVKVNYGTKTITERFVDKEQANAFVTWLNSTLGISYSAITMIDYTGWSR